MRAGVISAFLQPLIVVLGVPGAFMGLVDWIIHPTGVAEAMAGIMYVSFWLSLIGLVLGLIAGVLTGMACYLVLTPWLDPEAWPDLGPALRRGQLYGVLFSAPVGGLIMGWGKSSYAAYLPAVLIFDPLHLLGFCILLAPLCFVLGAFLLPIFKVLWPHLKLRMEARKGWEG